MEEFRNLKERKLDEIEIFKKIEKLKIRENEFEIEIIIVGIGVRKSICVYFSFFSTSINNTVFSSMF